MKSRRRFLYSTAAGGIAGIVAAGKAPAFAVETGLLKIGQLGLGGHNFALVFARDSYRSVVKARPYAFWDDYPGINDIFKKRGFEVTYDDPVDVVKNSDVICIEHHDYRRSLELARPALEMGKPVFIDRPFTASIYSAEEMIRLARKHDAPFMSCSSLELQPQLTEIAKFAEENGPVKSYECFCPEPMFQWMFPHVINFAHAALGGGIDTAYFAGDYIIEIGDIRGDRNLHRWVDPGRPLGDAVSVLTYKPRNVQPPIVGINHIGPGPGTYNLKVYADKASKNFVVGERLDDPKIFAPMFYALNDFFATRKPPRPYEAILEQHRAHVATAVSRLTGHAVRLDSLGGDDALPYSPSARDWLNKSYFN